jgi:hypothetical protein
VNTQRIKENSTVPDVASWAAARDSLDLSISRQSSFALGVEGVAVSVLSEVATRAAIHVKCSFDPLEDIAERGHGAQLGLFDTLFGLATMTCARTVTIGRSNENIRGLLLERVWRRLQEGRGIVGDGKQRSLVCRDPEEPLSETLRTPDGSFPRRDKFGAILFEEARSIGTGARKRYSAAEEDAITFIYEAAKNSFEHGRHDERGAPIRGVRGVILKKISFTSREDLVRRGDLTSLQRDFFLRQWPDLRESRLATSYTVSDLGVGIHRTLPALTAEETPWERLERAFRPSQSRKARGVDIESGMGLPKLCAAAKRLRAFLLIRSSELSAYCDFSARDMDPDHVELAPMENDTDARGTALTLIWSVVAQPSLL